jgi:hypothetical protein
MLEVAGSIEWHRDAQEISRGPYFHVIRPHVQIIAGEPVEG